MTQAAIQLEKSAPLDDFLVITPEVGVPHIPEQKFYDLLTTATAACETAKDLSKFGVDLDTTSPEEDAMVHTLAAAYAADPEKASKALTANNLSDMTPASIVLTRSILDEFSHLVVRDSQRIRNLVTNKLLIESENPDARIRMRALELLGKISDVGLFTEKKEITITNQSTEEIRASLKTRLRAMMNDEPAAEAEYEPLD